jgi:SAM-dependent methyltransferase
LSLEKKALNALHDRAVFRRRVRRLSELVAAELQGGSTVLDLGCGDGSVARAIMEARPQYDIRGIDVHPRPHTWIPVDLFDGRTIPFADKSFDWVTIVDVLHHADDAHGLLTEAARVAGLGVVVKDHLREGLGAYPTLRFMDWVGNKGHDVRLPYNYLSRREWTQALARTGLTARTWNEKLDLYPFPFNLLFDRHLHFVATLVPDRRHG